MSESGINWVIGCASTFLVVFAVCILFGGVVNVVNPANVAIVKRLGTLDQSPRSAGFYLEVPFMAEYSYYDLRVQAQNTLQTAGTKDLQDVSINVTVNWKLRADEILNLFQTIGTEDNLLLNIINPVVAENVKAVTAQYSAQELLSNRAEITSKILERLKVAFEVYPIEIIDASLTNIEFTNQDFKNATEQKQIAEQRALQAKYELEQAQIQAQIQAFQTSTLTPQILQKTFLEKWNGVLPTYMTNESFQALFNIK